MSAPVIWFLAGVVFFLAELFSPVFIMLFLGLGAWAAAVVSLFSANIAVALLVFSLVSAGSLLLLRRLLVRTFRGGKRLASESVADGSHSIYVGKIAVVTRSITPETPGEITFGGSYWRAVAKIPIAEGTTVRVRGNVPGDDLTLHVVPEEAGATN